MRNRVAASLACLCMLALLASPLRGEVEATLTNDEIVKMVKAGVSESIIIQTIKTSKHDFDMTPNGIIALKDQRVSDPIIEAMQGAAAPIAQPAPAAPPTPGPMGMSVTLVDGTNRIQMKYSNSQGRSGFGKVKLALDGPQSKLRITNSTPGFEVGLPANADPSGLITIAVPDVRSDRREVAIAHGGLFRGSSGIPKEKTIAVSIAELPSAGGQMAGFLKQYKVTPVAPLAAGEYFLVVQGYTLYDFGIDSPK